jgi:hypothetical protein
LHPPPCPGQTNGLHSCRSIIHELSLASRTVPLSTARLPGCHLRKMSKALHSLVHRARAFVCIPNVSASCMRKCGRATGRQGGRARALSRQHISESENRALQGQETLDLQLLRDLASCVQTAIVMDPTPLGFLTDVPKPSVTLSFFRLTTGKSAYTHTSLRAAQAHWSQAVSWPESSLEKGCRHRHVGCSSPSCLH